MTILKVLQYPDLRLRRKGYVVGNVKAIKIQKTIEDMVETLHHQESCAALAATQLDMENPPNITVINANNNPLSHNGYLCLINPEIIATEGVAIDEEGCMSLYPKNDIYAAVQRAAKIKVKALDIDGKKLEFSAKGHLARCIQHECDHLKGVLYIDHLSNTERQLLEAKMAKLI